MKKKRITVCMISQFSFVDNLTDEEAEAMQKCVGEDLLPSYKEKNEDKIKAWDTLESFICTTGYDVISIKKIEDA